MKKISKFFLLLVLLVAGMSNAWAAGYNGESHVYLNLNGTTKYYKVSTESWATGSTLPGTWGGVFADQTLGILTTLKIDGGAVGGWTKYGESLSGSVDYKVYPQGGSGSYSGSPKSFDKNSSYSGNNTFRYNNTWYKDILPTDAGVYSLQVKVKGGTTNYESVVKDFTVPGFTLTSTSQTDYESLVDEEQSKVISFTQHYGTALTTSNCLLSGDNADQFSVTAISETEVTVKFAPTSEGTKTATLTITDAHSKTCTISLSGEATAPASFSLTVEAGEHVTEVTGSVDDITFNTPYAISATVADGYQFAGWSKTKGAGNVTFGDASLAATTASVNGGSATVTASASPITYNITYVLPDGASKGDNPDTYTIESETITLKDASLTDKIFEGWFTTSEYAEQVTTIAQGSIGDTTLYAKFRDIKIYRLYYSNPEGWATVYAFLWKEGGSNNKAWPGEEITANTEVINNRTFYYYEFDETKEWNQIIFNIGSNAKQTGDISFSVPANDGQYNNTKAKPASVGTWQNLPEPIDPETPYTTVKVLCDYSSNVKIFFLNKSEDFMVIDAVEDGTSSEYPMNAVGEGQQTIDGKTGYLYEISFYGTCKMAIFVDASHIGTGNKLTANDVDLTKAAKVIYYFDLTGVVKGSPQSDTFSKIWVPLTQGYGTFCYPQPLQVSQAVPFWMEIEENMEEESGYELMMTAMEDNIIPANTGVLLYSKEKNAQAILTVVESTATYPDNDFEGTIERIAMPTLATGEKVYVLGNRSGMAFYDYQPTSGKIPAYKAYFRLTPKEEPQGAPSRVKMTFRSTPTDIETTYSEINNQPSKILKDGRLYIRHNGVIYTISGQVVQ